MEKREDRAMGNVMMAVAVAALVAGCVPMGTGVGAPVGDQPSQNQCGALDLQYLVGSPDTVLETMRFGGPVRIIPQGSAVTMDYNAVRINFELDRYRMISRVFCG